MAVMIFMSQVLITVWQCCNYKMLCNILKVYLTTVEFSKYLEEFRRVPVNFMFRSHWFLTCESWQGSFWRTPMHLLSRLKAKLFRWWSSFNSFSLVCNSVHSSLKIDEKKCQMIFWPQKVLKKGHGRIFIL